MAFIPRLRSLSSRILRRFANAVAGRARANKKSTKDQIRAALVSRDTAEVRASGFKARFRALSVTFQVPPGGFKPRTAKAFPMEKPEGLVFRARTYTNHQGKIIRRKGYLPEAIQEIFEGDAGKRLFAELGIGLAEIVGDETARRIVNNINKIASRAARAFRT